MISKRTLIGTLGTMTLAPKADAYSRWHGIYFARGATTVTERGREILQDAALFYPTALDGFRRLEQFGVIPSAPSPWIHVGGWAADGAHDAENEFLASMRALNTVQVLLEAGLPPGFIVASSYAARERFFGAEDINGPGNCAAYVSFRPSPERRVGGLPSFER